jgi:hypothetical protein
LFKYEFKKLFSVKWFIALLLVFFGVSAAVHLYNANIYRLPSRYTDEQTEAINAFVREYGLDDAKYKAFEKEVQELKNKINEEINKELTKAYQEGKSEEELREMQQQARSRRDTYIYSDLIMDDLLMNEMKIRQRARSEYLSTVNIITDQAKRNAENLRDEQGMSTGDPLYQYQIYVYQTYDKVMQNADVGVDTVVGWDRLFAYNYSDIFLFVSLILFAGAVFLSENQNGMTPILRAAKKGRLPTAMAKISVVFCGGAALALIYSISSFLVVLAVIGYSDPSVSVQNIKALTAFPYAFSILQYYLYGIMLKVVSAAAFAMICGFLAALIRNQAIYYVSSASVFGISFALGKIPATEHPALHGLNLYSICNVMPVSERLYVFQPFVSCMSYYLLAPVLCGIIIVISGALAAVSFCSVRYAGRTKFTLFSDVAAKIKAAFTRGRGAKIKSREKHTKNMFLWECGKALTANLPVLLLVIVLFAAHIAVCIVGRVNSEPSREERIYNKFVLSEVHGKFSETGDKCGFMVNIFTLQNKELYDQTFADALERGIITEEESARIRESLDFIDKNELNGNLYYSKEKYSKNLELYNKGLDPEFIDETGVSPIITQGASYPLYAAILFICTTLYMIEYGGKSKSENFANILRSTKNGRKKTFNAKLFAGMTISAAFALIYNIAEFVIFAAGRNLTCLNAPLYSVTAYADAGLTITVLQYMILMYALRVVIAVVFAVFALGVASIAKNLTLSFGITAGSTLLPTLLYSAGFDRAGFVSFGDFFGVNGMVRFSSMENAFGHPLGAFILYGVLFTAVSVVLTLISRARFTK